LQLGQDFGSKLTKRTCHTFLQYGQRAIVYSIFNPLWTVSNGISNITSKT